jgi:hypothetical protein
MREVGQAAQTRDLGGNARESLPRSCEQLPRSCEQLPRPREPLPIPRESMPIPRESMPSSRASGRYEPALRSTPRHCHARSGHAAETY